MKTITKTCKVHGETIFVIDKRNTYRCRKCRVDAVQKRRRKVKKMAIEYKGSKCAKCGLKDDCPDIYDFHHRDSNEKDFNLGHKGYCRAWEKVKTELDKCDMLCANCHRREHYRLNNLYL